MAESFLAFRRYHATATLRLLPEAPTDYAILKCRHAAIFCLCRFFFHFFVIFHVIICRCQLSLSLPPLLTLMLPCRLAAAIDTLTFIDY